MQANETLKNTLAGEDGVTTDFVGDGKLQQTGRQQQK